MILRMKIRKSICRRGGEEKLFFLDKRGFRCYIAIIKKEQRQRREEYGGKAFTENSAGYAESGKGGSFGTWSWSCAAETSRYGRMPVQEAARRTACGRKAGMEGSRGECPGRTSSGGQAATEAPVSAACCSREPGEAFGCTHPGASVLLRQQERRFP